MVKHLTLGSALVSLDDCLYLLAFHRLSSSSLLRNSLIQVLLSVQLAGLFLMGIVLSLRDYMRRLF